MAFANQPTTLLFIILSSVLTSCIIHTPSALPFKEDAVDDSFTPMRNMTGISSRYTNTLSENIGCASWDFKTAFCYLRGEPRSLKLVRKYSKSACTEGHSYGFAKDQSHGYRLIVKHGCRGLFNYGLRYETNNKHQIDCSSIDYKTATCDAGAGNVHYVELEEKYSRSACTGRVSYWATPSGVTVTNGCRGRFNVYTNQSP